MKLIILSLFLASCATNQCNMTKKRYYLKTEETIGYRCPDGHYLNIKSFTCIKEERETVKIAPIKRFKVKHEEMGIDCVKAIYKANKCGVNI